jgi:hypothetical protein
MTMEPQALSELQLRVLWALVEGYRAREGLKDRIRALNEWEIARRAQLTHVSYAEFFDHPGRGAVSAALSRLQRLGLLSVWEHGVKYDTFVPTAKGEALVLGSPGDVGPATMSGEPTPGMDEASSDPILQRLDEIIRLLRSLDAKLEGR